MLNIMSLLVLHFVYRCFLLAETTAVLFLASSQGFLIFFFVSTITYKPLHLA